MPAAIEERELALDRKASVARKPRAPKVDGVSISRLASAAGIQRYVISVLIETYKIPCVKLCNHKVILWDSLPDLIEILKEYPGVRPGFENDLIAAD